MNHLRPAFSLIELVITMLIVGILAGVAAPRYSQALRSQRLASASRQIAADLQRARDEAVRTSTRTRVEFFPANDRYELQYTKDPAPLPYAAGEERPGEFFFPDPNHPSQPFWVDLTQTGYAVQLDVVDFSGSESVTFDTHGRPDSRGVVTITGGGESREVGVSLSGQISIGEG